LPFFFFLKNITLCCTTYFCAFFFVTLFLASLALEGGATAVAGIAMAVAVEVYKCHCKPHEYLDIPGLYTGRAGFVIHTEKLL